MIDWQRTTITEGVEDEGDDAQMLQAWLKSESMKSKGLRKGLLLERRKVRQRVWA